MSVSRTVGTFARRSYESTYDNPGPAREARLEARPAAGSRAAHLSGAD